MIVPRSIIYLFSCYHEHISKVRRSIIEGLTYDSQCVGFIETYHPRLSFMITQLPREN